MPINPVTPGPVFADTSHQSALRTSEATARTSREASDQPQASVPEANQRVSPNQASSEGNPSRGSADSAGQEQDGNNRLDIFV